MSHFEDALDEVQASVTEETKRQYEEIERKFNQSEVDGDDGVVGEAFQ
jgi:transitional endoplasmic reticulum ATPase